MVRLRFLVVPEPFHDLAVLADGGLGQLRERLLDLGADVGVGAEQLRGGERAAEKRARDLSLHRDALVERAALAVGADVDVFRRGRGRDDKLARAVGDHDIEQEAAGLAQDGVDFREERAVAAEVVVVPKVKREPCAASGQ